MAADPVLNLYNLNLILEGVVAENVEEVFLVTSIRQVSFSPAHGIS